MEVRTKTIEELSVEEREEILIDVAKTLEGNAREALVEGNKQFAILSTNMAEAIRVNADELARDDPENAERLLQQAVAMISQFNATHPYRLVSTAVH
ncbi:MULTISPECIES: hypothetical protein [Rhizobium]|uniref:Tfp pilus assembly protein PilV n=1 Tax=Rhizobium tropici TaxID=398 RepID=A0A6P1C0M0_RHITR|nr:MULTISPECIES: hypothetical protein [Rhizobium]AGB74591.1 hypothetical protein RTCIAT899_PC03960 [Rhizobium tropici CIAT 899]MBB4242670.1 Tfp pilus assembly protein PilV [Rhizobium tropici]MBB5594425.1 Tfp pilus assembly protein PilV [Rhizobium tropici]MBB6492995.1 Tfp pilus assembly protein PilV [Rhizobium tropici]NEV10659.1 hypothetical protein [Rhizobium tropici]